MERHPNMMAVQQLRTARELIRAKRYEEAHDLLKTVDHPTAHEWTARLEHVTGRKTLNFDDLRSGLDTQPIEVVSANPKRRPWGWLALAALFGVGGAIALAMGHIAGLFPLALGIVGGWWVTKL